MTSPPRIYYENGVTNIDVPNVSGELKVRLGPSLTEVLVVSTTAAVVSGNFVISGITVSADGTGLATGSLYKTTAGVLSIV